MKKAVALALCQVCVLALAQPAPAARGAAAAGDAAFTCGGVAQEDQQAMKAQAAQHDLMLTFAVSSGAYLADVDVEIRSNRGALVLSAKCDGPIMLVDLPGAGTWRVTARVDGQTRQATVTTSGRARPARATLIWPAGTSGS